MDWLSTFRTQKCATAIDSGGFERDAYWTNQSFSTGSYVGQLATDSIDGARPATDISVVSDSPVIFLGPLLDMWWGKESDVSGDQAPPGTTTFLQAGDILIPYPSGVVGLVS